MEIAGRVLECRKVPSSNVTGLELRGQAPGATYTVIPTLRASPDAAHKLLLRLMILTIAVSMGIEY